METALTNTSSFSRTVEFKEKVQTLIKTVTQLTNTREYSQYGPKLLSFIYLSFLEYYNYFSYYLFVIIMFKNVLYIVYELIWYDTKPIT